MIDKFRSDATAAVAAIPSGATLAVGGFGSSGRPDTLLDVLCDLDRRDLHVIVNNVGGDFTGIGRLLLERRIRRLTASFPVLQDFYDEYFAGRVELELIRRGRSRSGCGLAARAFPPSSRRPGRAPCSPTAPSPFGYRADGQIADRMPERERREFGGREHILEYGIVADFALVKAYQGDRKGNLRFRLSARNFNPLAAMSGRHTFAEVEHLVGTGELGPDDIHLPGVFVDEVLLKSELSPRKPDISEFSS